MTGRRGAFETRRQHRLALTYSVRHSPAAPATELAPRHGEEHILFLRPPRSGRRDAIEMLPPTSDDLSALAR